MCTYLLALFDPAANAAVACPPAKAAAIGAFLVESGLETATVAEDQLCAVFGGSDAAMSLQPVKGVSKQLPGAFAAQFKC
eukprot:1271426-Pleurochrysis_carterae.AAC.1